MNENSSMEGIIDITDERKKKERKKEKKKTIDQSNNLYENVKSEKKEFQYQSNLSNLAKGLKNHSRDIFHAWIDAIIR